MGCGCDQNDEPTAFVNLRIPEASRCRKHGIAGMMKLIEMGDRLDDDAIKANRCACRPCPHRDRRGSWVICGKDGRAVHYLTALASVGCADGRFPRSTVD